MQARVTAELSTGFADERPIDIFSKRALERVALHQPETDAVSAGVGNQIRFDCDSIRRKRPPPMDQTLGMWEDLGLLGESGCREPGEPDPVRDLTTWEKLARKYPPKKFDLWGLKLETWGRLCERSTPRSASSWAAVFEAGTNPRSAWRVSWPGSILWRAQLSAISRGLDDHGAPR